MDFSPIINVVLKLWWVLPFVFLIAVFKSSWFKGISGEMLVKFSARIKLPADTYHAFHNVTLPTLDGTTQIDHIFISRYGIFVVETKNMKGWIYGAEHQPQWTQKIFKQSFKFQNPLRQNYKHIKAVEAALEISEDTVHSVIVFVGASNLKSPMPPNVTQGGAYIKYIKSFNSHVFTGRQVQELIAKIKIERLPPTRETHKQHVQQLKTRSDPSAERRCPKCGSPMVLRTTKRGDNAGNQFWGCSAYPKCKIMQNIS